MSAGLAGFSAIQAFPGALPGCQGTIDTFLGFNAGRLYSLRAQLVVDVAAVLAQHFNDLRCNTADGATPGFRVTAHHSRWKDTIHIGSFT